MLKYLRKRRQQKMRKDLKNVQGDELYGFHIVHWEQNRLWCKVRVGFWRRWNMLKKSSN